MKVQPAKRGEPERAAASLLERFEVSGPPVPVEEIARGLDYRVVYETLPSDTSSLLIREPDGRQVIGINNMHAARRQRFSLAHELGHALLHIKPGTDATSAAVVSRPLEVLYRDGLASQGTNRIEIDANQFAATLLMPEQFVKEHFLAQWRSGSRPGLDLVIDDLADEFEVSSQAMRFRLVNLSLIDPT